MDLPKIKEIIPKRDESNNSVDYESLRHKTIKLKSGKYNTINNETP